MFIILKDFPGSPDGFTVIHYKAGPEPVDLPESLQQVAVENGWAKPFAKPAVKPAAKKQKSSPTEAEQKLAALTAEIAALENELADADDVDDAATIEAQLAEKRAALSDLQG